MGGLLNQLKWQVKTKVKLAYRVVEAAWHMVQDYPKDCPCCGYRGSFLPYGNPVKFGSECPKCASLERHRMLALAVDERGLGESAGRMLHFAPEKMVARMFSGVEYVSADIEPGRADLVLNMEDIAQPDGSFDIVIANHVLEHVDDRKALAEIYRILRPGGMLIAVVPLIEGWDETYEDPSITSSTDRHRHFLQGDHVRLYGRDFRSLVKGFGFELDEFVADGPGSVRFGLKRGHRVFFASRGTS